MSLRRLGVVLCLGGAAAAWAPPRPGAPPGPSGGLTEVRGRLFTPDGAPLPPLRLFARTPAGLDSADVEASGDFLLRTAAAPESVELLIDAPTPSERRYAPSVVHTTPAELSDLRVVLVPRRWTVAAGSYATESVDIRIDAALAAPGSGAGFWRLSSVAPPAAPVAVGWPAGRFPIPVAFRRPSTIGPADSAAFWAIARQLERDFGVALFQPAAWDPADVATPRIVVGIDRSLHVAGLTFVTWAGGGDVYDGDVIVRSTALLHEPRVVTHELLHALGLGHTGAWVSVLGATRSPVWRATLHDVAYGQVLQQVRWAQRTFRAPHGIAAAAEGERTADQWRAGPRGSP